MQNQEFNQEDQNNENLAHGIIEGQEEELQLNQDDSAQNAEDLSVIEPAAGDQPSSDAQNTNLNLNSANFQAQFTPSPFAGNEEAIGVLDETELDYSVAPVSFSALSEIARSNLAASPSIAPQNQDAEPERFETNVVFSNATRNQTIIDATDAYTLDLAAINNVQAIFGEEMDIQGVTDTTHVDVTFQPEESIRIILQSDWNALKNVEVQSDALNNVYLENFVHADVALTHEQDTTIEIIDAKRGFIETAQGDDIIFIKALTNGAGWSNTFDIDSGAGNDQITLRGSKGFTIADINAGDGDDIVWVRGNYETSNTDLGNGEDIFRGGKADDVVRGGNGNDRINGGQGNDLLYGGDTSVAQATLTESRIDVEFVKSQAGFKNTVGFYKVASDGTIQDVEIVFENLKALTPGDTQSYIEAAHSASVELFIIANGYNRNGKYEDLDLSADNLDFIYNQGQSDERAAKITDPADSVTLVYNDGTQEIALNGNIFHAIQDLNIDGEDHTRETVQGDATEIAFEDLINLGDRDFSDAVVTFEETPLYDFNYGVIGNDNDILNGNRGNDVIMGGAGEDRINGGQDTDIAIFSGAINEYMITQRGNRTIIEDKIEGRDGIDTLIGVEGVLFGLEDLYAETASSNQTASNIDLADFLEGYEPIQDAIDTFVNNADQGQISSINVQSDVPSFTIFTIQDALAENQVTVI